MNAITFMTRENSKSSFVQSAGLNIAVAPAVAYRFNSAVVWDPKFRAAAKQRLRDFVESQGLPSQFATVDDRSVERVVLSDEQRAAVDELREAMRSARPELRSPGAGATAPERMGMPPFICVTSITCLTALLVIVQQNVSDYESDYEAAAEYRKEI